MASEHIFKIDEQNAGFRINKSYKNDYRFPVEMIVNGRKHSQVEVILNKPHGKKVVLEYIIKMLLKGPKHYNTFIIHLLKKFEWLDISDSLEILLLAGIIQITYKNIKPQKAIEWLPKIIQIDVDEIGSLAVKKADYDSIFSELNEKVTELLINNKSIIKENILHWIAEKEIRDLSDNVIANYLSFKRFKSIILTVAYYVLLKENGEIMPLRYLSYQIWGQPEVLSYYRVESSTLAQVTLDEFDAILLPDINDGLEEQLILILPLENLQILLSEFLNNDSLKDDRVLYLKEIDECMQNIMTFVDDNNFFSACNNLKSLILERDVNDLIKLSIHSMIDLIKNLKKKLIKMKDIRYKFELIVLEEIGRGSFAVVYKVFDPEIKKIVACKVLYPNDYFKQVYGKNEDEYLLRFNREVRLLTKELRHINIVNVLKAKLDDMPFWFTMPLADFTLYQWIKDNKKASETERLKIYLDILAGVKYLHKNDKFHRDLAPNNILLYVTENGLEVKIADFGLAKDINSMSFLTGSSKRGYGHEYFADPNQRYSLASSTHLSDIYSLGALLYYIIRGDLPKVKKMFYAPVLCQDIVTKAMDKPERRYQSVSELENDLINYVQVMKNIIMANENSKVNTK